MKYHRFSETRDYLNVSVIGNLVFGKITSAFNRKKSLRKSVRFLAIDIRLIYIFISFACYASIWRIRDRPKNKRNGAEGGLSVLQLLPLDG